MSKRVPVCRVPELPEGESRRILCDVEPIAVFNVDGAFYACSDACPHAGGPLHQGYIEGTRVACPWHGWSFDLTADASAPKDGVTRYPVVVIDDELFVEIPV